MMRRIRQDSAEAKSNSAGNSEGQVRRLILLDRPVEAEIEAWERKLREYRKEGWPKELGKAKHELETFETSMEGFLQGGCEVKVVYDDAGTHEMLPADLGFRPGDSELAIYDDVRIDVFGGGSGKRITDLRVFSKSVQNFSHYLKRTEGYFETLWAKAEPAGVFFARLAQAQARAEAELAYVDQWLTLYEVDLNHADRQLKEWELGKVRDIIRARQLQGRIQRYLDVGTCTGRYLFALRDVVKENGTIVGIDNDPACIRIAKARAEAVGDRRIRVLELDFCKQDRKELGAFDLVTCMLGTSSYFGWNRNPKTFEDNLQKALKKAALSLRAQGLFVIGKWSDYACRTKHFLSIYTSQDRERLARWTPPREEFQKRLAEAGLNGRPVRVEKLSLIDLFVCRRAGEP
jgi:SAM-dependent methyltransferase